MCETKQWLSIWLPNFSTFQVPTIALYSKEVFNTVVIDSLSFSLNLCVAFFKGFPVPGSTFYLFYISTRIYSKQIVCVYL